MLKIKDKVKLIDGTIATIVDIKNEPISLNEVYLIDKQYQGDDYLYKDEDKKEHWLFSTSYTDKYIWLENFLKAEVEIIEEPKKIKKIARCDDVKMTHYGELYKPTENQEILRIKINEIIDKINNLKEND